MGEALRGSGKLVSGLLAVFALAGCARTNAPSINVWLEPGLHQVMGISVEVSRGQTIIRDPGCGVFLLGKRRELATPGFAYEYTVETATDLTPECEIAGEARLVQLGSSVEGWDRQRFPFGRGMSYLLLAGSCMPGHGCETLLGRYFNQSSPPQTSNYREIARRNAVDNPPKVR